MPPASRAAGKHRALPAPRAAPRRNNEASRAGPSHGQRPSSPPSRAGKRKQRVAAPIAPKEEVAPAPASSSLEQIVERSLSSTTQAGSSSGSGGSSFSPKATGWAPSSSFTRSRSSSLTPDSERVGAAVRLQRMARGRLARLTHAATRSSGPIHAGGGGGGSSGGDKDVVAGRGIAGRSSGGGGRPLPSQGDLPAPLPHAAAPAARGGADAAPPPPGPHPPPPATLARPVASAGPSATTPPPASPEEATPPVQPSPAAVATPSDSSASAGASEGGSEQRYGGTPLPGGGDVGRALEPLRTVEEPRRRSAAALCLQKVVRGRSARSRLLPREEGETSSSRGEPSGRSRGEASGRSNSSSLSGGMSGAMAGGDAQGAVAWLASVDAAEEEATPLTGVGGLAGGLALGLAAALPPASW